VVTAIVPDGVGFCDPAARLATQTEGGRKVPSFGKRDGLYGVQIITGPRSVLLRLELLDERIEDFEVAAYTTEGLYRDPTPDVVRTRVFEGTDEANSEFGTSYHPWLARYAVDDYNDECFILRRAAYCIVARPAQVGESGYEGLS
jgi:hypothetical protein